MKKEVFIEYEQRLVHELVKMIMAGEKKAGRKDVASNGA